MKKSKIMLGTGLGALAVTGIAVASQSDGNVVDTVVKDTVVDFAISGKEPIKAKAAWTNPTQKFVYPGFEYYVVTYSEEAERRDLNYFANKLGVSVDTLRYLNDIKDGERVTASWGSPFAGSLLFYKSPYPRDRQHYYNLSQQAPIQITADNWKNKRAHNTEDNVQRYPSANYFTYSLFENEIELNSLNQLVLKGWAAQVNYTDTTGHNNQTAIIVTEEGKTDAVSVNVASNTNINPSWQFVYNKANKDNVAKRCPQSDAYLDREIAFTNVGAWASTSLGGCWHNFENSGFDVRIDVANLFSGDNYNKVYDLYIAQSTGANPNRLLYKPLSSRSIVTTKYQNDRFSGTITFQGKDTKIVNGSTTINVFDADLVMYKSLSTSDYNVVNGSKVFKPGRYKVINHAKQPESSTIYYQLEGYGDTAGYTGWASSVFMAESGSIAQLKFTIDDWEKFKLHFVSGDKEDKGAVLQTPKEFTLYANSSLGPTSVNINKSNYEKIKNGNIVWKLQKETVNPDNRDYTVEFNASNAPKDITYTYTKNYEVQVNYINANTGELITSDKKEIPYGETMNFKYSDLGTVDTDNSLINFRGKKYKFAGDGKTSVGGAITNIMDYKSDFTKVGLDKYNTDLNKYGNSANQSRTFDDYNLSQGIDNVNFYYYEPQTYTTNHIRIDSAGNWVKSDGKPTNVLSEATVTKDTGAYYTGQNVSIQGYGVANRDVNEAVFGDYKFAGKGEYEKSPKIYNALSLTGSNKYENVSKGQENLRLGLTKLNTEEYGNYANLYYRRAIKNPSGNCELGEDCEPSTTPNNPSNPGNPNGTGENGNLGDYEPSLTGQYNWYLTKEKDVKSDNWSQSKLALSNTGRVGNDKVYAIVNFKNTIAMNNEGRYNFQTRYAGQETDIYYSDLVTRRTVQTTVGEGITPNQQSMNITRTKNNNDYASATTVYNGRDYETLNKKLPLNSKLYKSGNVEDNYVADVEQKAGKGSKAIYETTYYYTNTFRDNYKAGESYNGAVFTWNYEYTNPVFDDKVKFEYKGITDVDHKLNEDSTIVLDKKDAKVKSKVGIVKDFNNSKLNGRREDFTESSTNDSGTVNNEYTVNKNLVTTATVNVRELPTTKSAFVGQIAEGTTIKATKLNTDGEIIFGTTKNWYYIDGKGWVTEYYLEELVNKNLETTETVKVRESPTIDSAKVGEIAKGTTIKATKLYTNGFSVFDNTNWYYIDGKGWVSGYYLKDTTVTTSLYETVTKTKTIDANLKTQSKVEAQEDIKYTNDVLNGKLDTFGADKEPFVGYRDSFNKFTYNNKNGYNQYLVKDVDFNYRNVDTVSSIKNNLMQKQSTDKTKLEDSNNYQYQMGLKVENTDSAMDSSNTQTVRLNLVNKYGILSDSGLLIENSTNEKLEDETEIAKQYKKDTGYDISSSDKLLKQDSYTSYYYIPFDGKSTLKTNEKYTNRNVLSNIGLSDINIAVDNSFQFNDYLVGSTKDDTVYTSYKTNLTKNGKYTKGQVVITSKEKDAIKNSADLQADDTKNFRTLNVKSMMDTLHKFIGFKN